MGQKTSKIDRKAKALAEAVRNTKPTPMVHDPLPPTVPLTRFPLWDTIIRAEGHDNLEEAIHAFIKKHDLPALLEFIAKEHHEDPTETWNRFILRYLDERNPKKMVARQTSALLADMLRDELDLSGFRLGTALQRWQRIVQRSNDLDRRDERERGMLFNSIITFLRYHGLRRLVECLREVHANEPGMHRALSTFLDTDEQTGKSIVYEVDPDCIAMSNTAIATSLLDWLTGSELSFPETRFTESKNPWAGLAGERLPTDDAESMDTMAVAYNGVPIFWRLLYQRALRHVECWTLEDLIAAVIESSEEPRLSRWMALSAEDMMRYGRRRDPVERVVAFLVDNMVSWKRASRNIIQDTVNTRILQNVNTPETQESEDHSEQPAPIPPPAGQQQEVDTEAREGAGSKIRSPAAQDLAHVDALYDDLVMESEALRFENVELEETISHLLEDITTLQHQVDMEAGDATWQERDCPICGQFLTDEKSECAHMKLHRDEINECRKKNKRSPLPGSRSPSGLKKPPSRSSSKDSSPPSNGGDSPKALRRTGLSPRRGRRSSPGMTKRGRKSLSRGPHQSSEGHKPKDGGKEVVPSTEGPDGRAAQHASAIRSEAAPLNEPDGLGIWIPLPKASAEPNDALTRPPVMPGSGRPLTAPSPPARTLASQGPRNRTDSNPGRPASRSSGKASRAGTKSPSKPKTKSKGRGRASSRASNQASRPRSLSSAAIQPHSPRKTRSQSKASREGNWSRSPSVEPAKPKAKKRTAKTVQAFPSIPEGDDEDDGLNIMVGRVEVPEYAFDPADLLTSPRKRSAGQAFVEFMRDYRESPEDAKRRKT